MLKCSICGSFTYMQRKIIVGFLAVGLIVLGVLRFRFTKADPKIEHCQSIATQDSSQQSGVEFQNWIDTHKGTWELLKSGKETTDESTVKDFALLQVNKDKFYNKAYNNCMKN